MSMKIYVGNLSYEVRDSDLSDLFQPFGAVENAKVVTDRYTGVSRGFGFVEMASRQAGERAILEMNGQMIHNRKIVVGEARSSDTKARSGGRGGHRDGRRRF